MAAIKTRLKRLQRRLGVNPDGILGPITMTRIESEIWRPDSPPGPRGGLLISTLGIDELIRFEISSAANYRRRLSRPTWPGGDSGVTIGIGYDLGQVSRDQLDDDWRGRIPDNAVDWLMTAVGARGETARLRALDLTDIVEIPLDVARRVFFERSLPAWARRLRAVYPSVGRLPPDAQAALLSLVYNRGTSMTGERRREMAEIKPLVAIGDLAAIADRVRAMKRLWDSAELPGLHRRRDREAELIEAARRDYAPDELVRV